MTRLAIALAVLVAGASAHFTLNLPVSIGFDEDTEDMGYCGNFIPNFSTDKVSDFHLGGEMFSTTLGHQSATFLYRATLDLNATTGWVPLYPIVMQTGLGNFCVPQVQAPDSFASWAGQRGIIGVAGHVPDGILYQCATVNFVTGVATVTSACSNATGVTGAFSTDPSLTADVGASTSAAGSLYSPDSHLSRVGLLAATVLLVLGAAWL